MAARAWDLVLAAPIAAVPSPTPTQRRDALAVDASHSLQAAADVIEQVPPCIADVTRARGLIADALRSLVELEAQILSMETVNEAFQNAIEWRRA